MSTVAKIEEIINGDTVEDSTSPELLSGSDLLDTVEAWLSTYIRTAQPQDMWILVLWFVHTWLVDETYTTPRLLLDSPVPGSGKTTVIDHAGRLCYSPVSAAALSSSSLLARLLEKEPRTILIDEAEKSLHPKKEGVHDLLAVLNSGYRKGGSRPVLVPDKEQGWRPVEMSTFGPVAMAGNAPDLPEDTQQRCIRVLLLPDSTGTVEDSAWEDIEPVALELAAEIAAWADSVRDDVRASRPEYPEGLRGRNRERWGPLLKVALAAGGKWPDRCRELIVNDLDDQTADRENGLQRTQRHVKLLQDIRRVWPEGESFMPTMDLLNSIRRTSPSMWSSQHEWGELTRQGFSRMLVKHFNIRSHREPSGERRRGYLRADFESAWSIFPEPSQGE